MSRYRLLAAVCLFPVVAGLAAACTVPVFRYALERWELTPYEIVIFHKEPLGDDAKGWIKKAESAPTANVRVEVVDLAREIPKGYQRLYERHGKDKPLPWVAVRLVDAAEKTPLAWNGPLEKDTLLSLIVSPVREAIVNRLKTGETGVFLFLESGDAPADQAARVLLEKELARLQKTIELPEPTEEGPQLKTGLPLKIGFTVMPLKRDDPAEQAFLKLVFATEDGLDKVKGPIILPVFGRGRLLCSLFGDDINATQIGNVARFLCGECSCQVKELNPGVDLIIPADWPDLLDKAGPPANARPDTPAAKRKQ